MLNKSRPAIGAVQQQVMETILFRKIILLEKSRCTFGESHMKPVHTMPESSYKFLIFDDPCGGRT